MSITRSDESVIYRYELKINEYDRERKWWKDLMQNTWLSGEHKLVLYSIREIIQAVRYDWDQPTCEPVLIWSKELQNRTGLHENTISRCTKQLHEADLINKITKREGKISRTSYTLHSKIYHTAKDIEIKTAGRNHGGLRQACEHCGSENIDLYTAYICRDCGHIHQADMTQLGTTKVIK